MAGLIEKVVYRHPLEAVSSKGTNAECTLRMLRCFTGKRKGEMTDLEEGVSSGTATPDNEPNEQLKSLEPQSVASSAQEAPVDAEALIPTTPISREVKLAWERPAASRLGQSEASTSEQGRWTVSLALGRQHKALESLG